MSNWTQQEYEDYLTRRASAIRTEIIGPPKANKYSAIKTEVDGIIFHSKREAKRYTELRIRQRAGEISGLALQPKYPLEINGIKVGDYIGDFLYTENGQRVVEDTKGVKTPVYKLKRRLMLALYGIEIRET